VLHSRQRRLARYQTTAVLVAPIEEIAMWRDYEDWSLELIELVALEFNYDGLMIDGVWWFVVPVTFHWYGNRTAFRHGKRIPAA